MVTAQVSGGSVIAIQVNDTGGGYSNSPTVTIDLPPPGLVYQSYWSNDSTSEVGSEPVTAIIDA